jgi:hypothetical protein
MLLEDVGIVVGMRNRRMPIPKPDRITKRTIAQTQLYRAVKLLDENASDFDPISALTLAGAAEEILGKMVNAKGMDTAFEESAFFTSQSWDFYCKRAEADGEVVEPLDEKEIRSRINRTRNELKHNNGGKNSPVDAYFLMEAEEMVLRALRNYEKLYGKLPPQKEVQEWWDFISL